MDAFNKIGTEIESRRDRILDLSRRIHAEPELAFEEHKTSLRLQSLLVDEGFAVEAGIAGLSTAFRAVRRCGADSPRLVYTAEMDALPEIGHACGHNLIAAAGVYAPIVLAAVLGTAAPGTIEVVGTPAEERGSGKVPLLEAGVFAGAGAVLQMHPYSLDTVVCRALARRTIIVECFGRAAHAAAAPHEGLNALDALILFYQSAALARSQFPPGCVFHGIIEDGGKVVNVIPDYARGRFSLRSDDMANLDRLFERIGACAHAAGEATGCRVTVTETGRSATTFKRNSALEDLFAPLFESIGRSNPRVIRRSLGSTDIANVSQAVPTMEIFVKASDHPIHTPEFAADAVAPPGERALLDAIFLLAAGGYRLMTEPALLESVREAFAAGHRGSD